MTFFAVVLDPCHLAKAQCSTSSTSRSSTYSPKMPLACLFAANPLQILVAFEVTIRYILEVLTKRNWRAIPNEAPATMLWRIISSTPFCILFLANGLDAIVAVVQIARPIPFVIVIHLHTAGFADMHNLRQDRRPRGHLRPEGTERVLNYPKRNFLGHLSSLQIHRRTLAPVSEAQVASRYRRHKFESCCLFSSSQTSRQQADHQAPYPPLNP